MFEIRSFWKPARAVYSREIETEKAGKTEASVLWLRIERNENGGQTSRLMSKQAGQ